MSRETQWEGYFLITFTGKGAEKGTVIFTAKHCNTPNTLTQNRFH
jgi:hypothetical protein